MILKIYIVFNLILSFFVNDGIVYRADNEITLIADEKAIVGTEYLFEGELYLIVDDSLLREKINTNANLSYLITTKVVDMSFLFYKSNLIDPLIDSWDVSNVKIMSWMFGLAEEINPNLSYWNTASVVDFSDMFHGTKEFEGDLSKWNTGSGVLFNGMFFESNFNGAINDWDLSSAKNLSGMFDDAKFFNQPLDKWNTSSVEDMGGMFAEALSFNQDLSMWDVSKVKNMMNMFRYAINLDRDLSNWEAPLLEAIPDNFSTNSPVRSPNWSLKKELGFKWYFFLPFILIISALVIFLKLKKKRPPLENGVYEALKTFLGKKGTNQISKIELDDILGTTNKSLETQRKVRSNFIKQFNNSGLGEISRFRDGFDSRSFNYEIKWNNPENN